VISQKQYVIITKKGLEFVSTIFSCAAPLAPEEIKLHGFLLRLVSFGGVLPPLLNETVGFGGNAGRHGEKGVRKDHRFQNGVAEERGPRGHQRDLGRDAQGVLCLVSDVGHLPKIGVLVSATKEFRSQENFRQPPQERPRFLS